MLVPKVVLGHRAQRETKEILDLKVFKVSMAKREIVEKLAQEEQLAIQELSKQSILFAMIINPRSSA
jgi:hypothetical protein